MNERLTAEAKALAYELGADLVGVGNIERWQNCPPLMSPAGILPDAKCVLVCGIHHTDAMIEIGGEKSPHVQGTYSYQMLMNSHLDVISYNLGRFLEDKGYKAVPVCASNIWRYREYKDLTATFAPDMSHIYSSIAAGLSELGYSGLAMTPEYGPRNRFVSIITDAPLLPTPLLPGDTLCDNCGMCTKHCPTDAFTKQSSGTVSIDIEGKKYTRCDKSLWRCSWGEHFGLDVDRELPEMVDEKAILDSVEKLGLRGGTMGCCIKYCLPRERRVWDKDYCSGPRRKKEVTPTSPEPIRGVQEKMVADMIEGGVDTVVIESAATWKERGVDLVELLPDVQSVMLIAVKYPVKGAGSTTEKQVNFGESAGYMGRHAAFYAARALEKQGYSGAPYLAGGIVPNALKERLAEAAGEGDFFPSFVLTSAVLTPGSHNGGRDRLPDYADLSEMCRDLAYNFGADLVGIAPADRVAQVAEQLRGTFDDELILHARDTGKRWLTSSGEVSESRRRVLTPEDHLTGARSVIVLGCRIPQSSADRACKEPAEAIGPYAFAAYQSHRSLNVIVLRMMKTLSDWGVKSTATYDLCNTGSFAANPRGPQPNAFCNRFAALCAGLGSLTKGGFINTPGFGANMRYVAIVVDAELDADDMLPLNSFREECDAGCSRCSNSCTVSAHRTEQCTIRINGESVSFRPVEQVRCDWALRYGLIPEEGVKYTGSSSNAPIPEKVTAEALAEGMGKQDTILKLRPCVAEMCMMACPYVRDQA